jgi:tetratricopeptide (TPR) repeat protein
MRSTALILSMAILAASSADASVEVLGNGLANACYRMARSAFGARDGEAACTAALESEPLSPRDLAATYINRGVVRSNLRRYQDSLADYDRAISFSRDLSNSDLGVAYVDRASVLNVLGRYGEALEDVNKGLSLHTASPEVAYYNRARAHEGLGDIKAAYFDYKQALAIRPGFTAAAEQLKRFHVTRSQGS